MPPPIFWCIRKEANFFPFFWHLIIRWLSLIVWIMSNDTFVTLDISKLLCLWLTWWLLVFMILLVKLCFSSTCVFLLYDALPLLTFFGAPVPLYCDLIAKYHCSKKQKQGGMRKRMYVYVWLGHYAVRQKLIQHCKWTIL